MQMMSYTLYLQWKMGKVQGAIERKFLWTVQPAMSFKVIQPVTTWNIPEVAGKVIFYSLRSGMEIMQVSFFLKVEQLISPGGALTAMGELCLTFCYEGRIDCKYWQQIQTSTHPSQCNYSSGSYNIHLRIRYIPCNNSNSLNQCQIVIFFGKIPTFSKRKAYSDHQCLALM